MCQSEWQEVEKSSPAEGGQWPVLGLENSILKGLAGLGGKGLWVRTNYTLPLFSNSKLYIYIYVLLLYKLACTGPQLYTLTYNQGVFHCLVRSLVFPEPHKTG